MSTSKCFQNVLKKKVNNYWGMRGFGNVELFGAGEGLFGGSSFDFILLAVFSIEVIALKPDTSCDGLILKLNELLPVGVFCWFCIWFMFCCCSGCIGCGCIICGWGAGGAGRLLGAVGACRDGFGLDGLLYNIENYSFKTCVCVFFVVLSQRFIFTIILVY